MTTAFRLVIGVGFPVFGGVVEIGSLLTYFAYLPLL
jgi:hypothetical protein